MVTNTGPRRHWISTHVPGLDAVLCGGLLRGGIYAVRGAPGAGKTILANQISYAHAKRGGRALYVTLLAESHARMMLHLEGMNFFDPELVDERVRYLSAYPALTAGGLRGVLEFIRSELSAGALERRPPPATPQESGGLILVIDGFLTISDLSGTVSELKAFIQDLQLYADLVGATVLLLTGPATDDSRPEYTMVDGIIELREQLHNLRAYSELRVRKLRGGAHLRGGHLYAISDDGITVYPRAEARYLTPTTEETLIEGKASTGVAPLDAMLGGGFGLHSTTLALGPSGIGKTTLGLHFLNATPPGERAVHFGFYETSVRLADKSDKLGLGLKAQVARGELEFVWRPSTEQSADALAEVLLDAIERNKATRLVVDGLDGFQRATHHKERVHQVFNALSNELRVRGVTSFYTYEVPKILGPELHTPVSGVSGLAENLIYLRFVQVRSQLYRLLSVLKVRDSTYDSTVHEYRIDDRGFLLENGNESAEAILSGNPIAR